MFSSCNWISVTPKITFIGVRISWLIFAKNADLALLAFSASILSCSILVFALSLILIMRIKRILSIKESTDPITMRICVIFFMLL